MDTQDVYNQRLCAWPRGKPPGRGPGEHDDIWIEWESERDKELSEMMKLRAIQLCQQCPALAACERALRDLEKQGRPVAGIVAGRVWTEPPPRCSSCNREMKPRGTPRPRLRKGEVIRANPHLCLPCWQRKNRRLKKDKAESGCRDP